MRIIESIKDALRKLDAKLNPPSPIRRITIHLRRGTMEEMLMVKPAHDGEVVLCMDQPCFGIGAGEKFEVVPFDPESEAGKAIRRHYSQDWLKVHPTW